MEKQPVSPRPESLQAQLETLRGYLKKKGLKQTAQRELVLKIFLDSPKYLSVDELTRRVRSKHPKLGLSTVYRSLRIFTECGLARENHFLYRGASFDPIFGAEAHDHLICKRCHKVQEFSNPLIQAVQEKVSKEFDFKREEHRVEIYGLCSECQGPKHLRPEE